MRGNYRLVCSKLARTAGAAALAAGFTLLVRRPGTGTGTIEKAARTRGVPLRVLEVPDPVHRGPALALVRPDQYVAWAGDREPADSLALIDRLRGAASS